MTTTTIERPHISSNDQVLAADYLLGMPATTPEEEAQERDLATRVVRRHGGQDVAELLDMLGLATAPPPHSPVEPTEPTPTKRCSRCGERKPRTEFTRSAKTADGLYCQCKECRNATRRALYARRGYRGMTRHDGDIKWRHAAPGGYGVSSSREAVERRISMWADLRIEQKLKPRPAAERMEISMRSARRYDRILKDRGLLPQTDGSGRVVG